MKRLGEATTGVVETPRRIPWAAENSPSVADNQGMTHHGSARSPPGNGRVAPASTVSRKACQTASRMIQ